METFSQRMTAVTCAVALGFLVACSPGTDGLGPLERDATVLPGEDRDLTERLHLPIYDYRTNEAQLRTITQAAGAHVESCMRGLGYDYTHVPETNEHLETDTAFFGPHGEYRRYGLVSLDSAEEYGFGAPEHLDGAEEGTDPPWRIDHGGQTEQDAMDALFGGREDVHTPSGEPVPVHGCFGWAHARVDPHMEIVTKEQAQEGIAGEQPGIAGTAEWIKAVSFDRALDDAEVIDAMGEWVVCMDGAGYPGEDFWLVGSSESAVAVDDTVAAITAVECKEEVGLIDLMVRVETEVQVELITRHETELLERHAQLEEAVENALTSLEEHP